MSTSAIGMSQALAARDAGMAQSAAKTEADCPGWSDIMYAAMVLSPYLRELDSWTIDFARNWLYACGYEQASSERAWGSLTQKLLRDSKIERVGFDRSASSRGSYKPTYRLVRAG